MSLTFILDIHLDGAPFLRRTILCFFIKNLNVINFSLQIGSTCSGGAGMGSLSSRFQSSSQGPEEAAEGTSHKHRCECKKRKRNAQCDCDSEQEEDDGRLDTPRR